MNFEDSPCFKCPRQAAMAEALRHANIDLSMLLPQLADRDMAKSIRKTLTMIDALSRHDRVPPQSPAVTKLVHALSEQAKEKCDGCRLSWKLNGWRHREPTPFECSAKVERQAIRALASQQQATSVPHSSAGSESVDITGWKLVPDRPTEEMWQAGRSADIHPGDSYSKVWSAMFDAAPNVDDSETTSRTVAASLAPPQTVPADNTPLQARVQHAIYLHPFFEGSASLAFGLAGAAIEAMHAPPQGVSEEQIAEIVYDAFPFIPNLPGESKPKWQSGGNSLMQDRARQAALAIRALSRPERGS